MKGSDSNHRREDSGYATIKSEESRESHSSKSGFKSPGVSKSSGHASSSSGGGGNNPSSNHSTSLNGASSTTPSTTTTSTESRTPIHDSKLMEATNHHRSSLDALQGLPKDVPLGTYRPHGVFPSLPGLPTSYPGLDAATAAALGLGGAGAFRHPYPHLGSLPGYPPVSLGLSLAGYPALNYGRMKSVNGSDSFPMAVCRDPYCTGCPSSVLAMSGASASGAPQQAPPTSAPVPSVAATQTAAGTTAVCPAGCTHCDHQKIVIGTTSQHSLSTASTLTTTATSSSSSPFSPGSANTRPYVCNWIAGDNYCGKRFCSSEELLQHLRTHTSLSVPVSDSAGFSSLLNPSLHLHSHLFAQAASSSAAAAAAAALHRTYPTPPLSPLSMARYHPYSKPTSALSSLAGSSPLSNLGPNPGNQLASLAGTNPLLSLGNAAAAAAQNQLAALSAGNSLASLASGNPLASLSHSHLSPYAANPLAGHPSLGPYYSHPYSLYSQRLGTGVLPWMIMELRVLSPCHKDARTHTYTHSKCLKKNIMMIQYGNVVVLLFLENIVSGVRILFSPSHTYPVISLFLCVFLLYNFYFIWNTWFWSGKSKKYHFFGLDFYLFSSPFCMLLAHDRSIKFLFLQTYRNPFTRQPSCMHLCICIVKNKKTTYSIAFLYKIVFSNTISFFFTK